MADWRVAKSLLKLREQANKAWPNRATASDGTIGDAAHATRDSDHNPWVRDGPMGVVTALDITHDPGDGADMNRLAEALRASRDPRVKYLIWNRRICRAYAKSSYAAWAWAPYTGSNPHTHHLHISVQPTKSLYDSVRAWPMPGATTPAPEVDDLTPEQDRILKRLEGQEKAADWQWYGAGREGVVGTHANRLQRAMDASELAVAKSDALEQQVAELKAMVEQLAARQDVEGEPLDYERLGREIAAQLDHVTVTEFDTTEETPS